MVIIQLATIGQLTVYSTRIAVDTPYSLIASWWGPPCILLLLKDCLIFSRSFALGLLRVGVASATEALYKLRGIHPPGAMVHFPPVSDFPPYFRKIFLFRVSSAKISDYPSFSHQL